jgi:hypothetical protein
MHFIYITLVAFTAIAMATLAAKERVSLFDGTLGAGGLSSAAPNQKRWFNEEFEWILYDDYWDDLLYYDDLSFNIANVDGPSSNVDGLDGSMMEVTAPNMLEYPAETAPSLDTVRILLLTWLLLCEGIQCSFWYRKPSLMISQPKYAFKQ